MIDKVLTQNKQSWDTMADKWFGMLLKLLEIKLLFMIPWIYSFPENLSSC